MSVFSEWCVTNNIMEKPACQRQSEEGHISIFFDHIQEDMSQDLKWHLLKKKIG